MKSLFLGVLLSLAAAGSAWAQATERINFQGKLTSSSGTPVNASLSLTFRIYTASAGGAAIWTETQAAVPVINGIYSVYLGDVSSLGALNFASAYWLSVQVDSDGEMTPRYRLSSSPYAIRARVADGLEGLTATAAQLNQLVGGGNADLLHSHDWSAITGKPALAQLTSANLFTGTQTINTGLPGSKGLLIKGAPSQTGNLQEWLENSGAVLASVSQQGGISGAGFTTAGNVSAGGASLGTLGVTGSATLNSANVQMQNASLNLTGATINGGSFAGGTFSGGATLTTLGVSGTATLNSATVQMQNSSLSLTGATVSGGTFTGGTFSGDGSGLTNVPAGALADGSVTAPKIAALPKVRAFNASTQTANAWAKVTLTFPAETYDTNNMHDNAVNPSRLKINTAGVYRLSTTIPFYSAQDGGWRMVEFKKNGSSIIGGIAYAGNPQASSGNQDLVSASVTDSFVVGDYVEVVFSQNNSYNNAVDVFRASATMEYIP